MFKTLSSNASGKSMNSTERNLESERLIYVKENASKNVENKSCMYLCCFVVLFGSTSVGLMLGITSPLIPAIQQDEQRNTPQLDPIEASWFGGLLPVGGLIGGLLAGYIANWIGRKLSSVFSALPYLIGLTIIALASHTWMLYFGRIVTGLGVGLSLLVVPIYIAEISPPGLRGMLSSATQLCITIGILLAYVFGILLPWRWVPAVICLFPLFLFVFSFFIVETPRYYMLKKKAAKARLVLQRLRGPNANINDEYNELETNLDDEIESASWWEIAKEKNLRTPTLLSLALMYFQQFAGINAVMFYAKTLFMTAGFTSVSQLNAAVLSVAGVQVLVTFITCLIIDKTGRKALLIVSGVFTALSMLAFGVYFVLLHSETSSDPKSTSITSNFTTTTYAKTAPNYSWLALTSMVVYMIAFSLGFGPVVWVYYSEIFPLRARGKAGGLSVAFVNLLTFVVTSWFSSMLITLTPQGTFWFFAGNCALSVPFTIFFLPETKGKSLEEIEIYFQS